MADLPLDLPTPELRGRLAAALDREEKIPRALDALGPVADRDVLLVGEGSLRAAQLSALGGRVRSIPGGGLAGEPARVADLVVAPWDGFRADAADSESEIAAARRVLRPAGRLLVLRDYGRDDVARLVPAEHEIARAGRSRDAWYLEHGFRIRVLHCFWTFDSLEEARDFLADAFGERGVALGDTLSRPRIAHKLVIYHQATDSPA